MGLQSDRPQEIPDVDIMVHAVYMLFLKFNKSYGTPWVDIKKFYLTYTDWFIDDIDNIEEYCMYYLSNRPLRSRNYYSCGMLYNNFILTNYCYHVVAKVEELITCNSKL